MELERRDYPGLLQSLEPDQAVDLLNGRVAIVNKIHADIADWLQERRRIEEQYATSLRKLARRPQQDNAAALGVFQVPWQRIVNSTENMAQSHETLAAKIQSDVESPLRQYQSTNHELQSMGNVAGNLSAIAKELTNAQRKAQKLDAKGSNKVDGARSSVEDAASQWESAAPYVFEQLQDLDEARVNHLRDVLTQLQTHELDAIERGRSSAESCLEALLNVETAEEIRLFVSRAKDQTGPGGSPTARRDSLISSSRPSGSNVPPTPPPPRQASVEHRNSSLLGQDRLAPLPEPPKKDKLSGLKRFGTVMSRRKNAAPPPVPTEKKKEKTRSFAPFRRQESSRSFHDLDSTGQDLSPSISRDDRASSRHESIRPPQTQESRISDAQSPPALNGTAPYTTPIEPSASIPQISIPELQSETVETSRSLPAVAGDRRSMLPDPFAQQYNTPASPGEESARNFEIKDQPIPEDASAAQIAMENIQNQLRMQAQNSGMSRPLGSVRGRRDVRNTMFVPNPQELPSSNSTYLSSPDTPISAATSLPISTSDGTAAALSDGTSDLVTPVKRSIGTGTIPEDASHITSDTQSVTSSHSMANLAHHQEMSSPGLNASLVETVNTWFTGADVTRSFVVGEIALAYNKPTSSSSNTHEVVRLQNYHQLEKCAQNPQFVTASSGEQQPGTFNVSLNSIAKSIPTVAFKYQLHMDDSNLGAASPLLVTQAWQIVEGQASAIVHYSLNPAFAPIANPGTAPRPTPQELTLKNVVLTVSLDTKPTSTGETVARAVGAQMMPVQGAQFKKRSSAVIWRFTELVLKPTQERLLVRFTVENNGLARHGGIDAKFEIHGMLGSALGVERLVTSTDAVTSAANSADPFADEAEARKSADGAQGWDDVQSRKILVSGKYTAA